MKRGTVIPAAGLLVGLLALSYGTWGPWYSTTPLEVPLSFSRAEQKASQFQVGRTEDYLVEVFFRRPPSAADLVPILGDYVQQHMGAIDIAWNVADGRGVVASGSSREYSYSPVFGATHDGLTHDGLTVGSFHARRGATYVLRLSVRNQEPGWDIYKPYVAVSLHPAKFEYLFLYSVLGVILSVLFGTVLVFSSPIVKRWLASNLGLELTARKRPQLNPHR